MAKHYRNFKRIFMDAKTATSLREWVDRMLLLHYTTRDIRATFTHELEQLRLLDNGLTIGKRRARLDLPDLEEPLLKLADMLERCAKVGLWAADYDAAQCKLTSREFAARVKILTKFQEIGREVRSYATRGPLVKLAETCN